MPHRLVITNFVTICITLKSGRTVMANIIVIIILIAVIGSACRYIYKSKKNGKHCMGCSGQGCSSCSRCNVKNLDEK